jgi:hypothetical protein
MTSSLSSRRPQLSVVVPTYNRAPLLRRTLVSLLRQRTPPSFEVIVADDGSSDDSEKVAAELGEHLPIRYVYQEDMGYRVAKARITAKRNSLLILNTHADPAVELFWAHFTRDTTMWPAEDSYRDLLDWTDHVTGLDVRPEVDAGTADLPRGARVAIFGSGSTVPGRDLRGTLVDFDARLLDQAPTDGRFTTHLGLGIRTPLPDRAVERVLITSRLARLWPEWGHAISAEAARIGASMHGPPVQGKSLGGRTSVLA